MNSNIPMMPFPVPAPEAPAAGKRVMPEDSGAPEQEGFSRVLDREVRSGGRERQSDVRKADRERRDATSGEAASRASESDSASGNGEQVYPPEESGNGTAGEKTLAAEDGRNDGKMLPSEDIGREAMVPPVVSPDLADMPFEDILVRGEAGRDPDAGRVASSVSPLAGLKEKSGMLKRIVAGQGISSLSQGSGSPASGNVGKGLDSARLTLESLVRDSIEAQIEKVADRVVTTATRWNGELRDFSRASSEVLQRVMDTVQNVPANPSGHTLSTAGSESLSAGVMRPVQLDMPAALGQPGWDRALGEKVTWMIGQKLHAAEIRVNPPHLGPLEVRIQVQNDQTQIHFHSQHAVVRDAIESALPRLREMMNQAGMDLGQVSIADHSQGRGRQEYAGQPGQGSAASSPEPEAEEAVMVKEISSQQARWHGGLDLFA